MRPCKWCLNGSVYAQKCELCQGNGILPDKKLLYDSKVLAPMKNLPITLYVDPGVYVSEIVVPRITWHFP